IDFFVCDAVRERNGGMLDIAGCYPTREVKIDPAARLPAAVNLTFVFILKDGEGRFRPVLRIIDPLAKELHRFEMPELAKEAGKGHVMMLPVGQIPFAHSGNYVVSVEIDGQRYDRVVRIFQ
ncbi:MAG TPA: hypothetical protein VM782_02280, partial [Stellaceae bacterium]|nr:hypothetical protein [Stellaceae bacterium]